VIGNKYETYIQLQERDVKPAAAMDELGLTRYCCRRMVLTHVDLIDKLLAYHTFSKHDDAKVGVGARGGGGGGGGGGGAAGGAGR